MCWDRDKLVEVPVISICNRCRARGSRKSISVARWPWAYDIDRADGVVVPDLLNSSL